MLCSGSPTCLLQHYYAPEKLTTNPRLENDEKTLCTKGPTMLCYFSTTIASKGHASSLSLFQNKKFILTLVMCLEHMLSMYHWIPFLGGIQRKSAHFCFWFFFFSIPNLWVFFFIPCRTNFISMCHMPKIKGTIFSTSKVYNTYSGLTPLNPFLSKKSYHVWPIFIIWNLKRILIKPNDIKPG